MGKVGFTDHRFADREEFSDMKSSGVLPFGQVPMLQVTHPDGTVTKIAQSFAILKYVCSLGGLYPTEDPLLAAAIDAQTIACSDMMAAHGVANYPSRSGLSHAPQPVLAEILEAQSKEVLPRHLSHLERALQDSATGWVCSTPRPSCADFAWGTQLRDLRCGAVAHVRPEVLAPFPLTNAFLDKFLDLPEVAAYYTAHP